MTLQEQLDQLETLRARDAELETREDEAWDTFMRAIRNDSDHSHIYAARLRTVTLQRRANREARWALQRDPETVEVAA